MGWYCLTTKCRMEKTARDNLIEQGYTIFLPMCHRETNRDRVEVMFPGYLFIHLIPEVHDFRAPCNTRGCGKLVTFGDHVAPVPGNVIHTLRNLADEDQIVRLDEDQFKVGERVVITEGLFQFYRGIIEAKSGTERVCLLLDSMTRLEIEKSHIRKEDK